MPDLVPANVQHLLVLLARHDLVPRLADRTVPETQYPVVVGMSQLVEHHGRLVVATEQVDQSTRVRNVYRLDHLRIMPMVHQPLRPRMILSRLQWMIQVDPDRYLAEMLQPTRGDQQRDLEQLAVDHPPYLVADRLVLAREQSLVELKSPTLQLHRRVIDETRLCRLRTWLLLAPVASLLADLLPHRDQPFGPGEFRCRLRVVAGQVTLQPGHRLGVYQFRLAEDLLAELRQTRVVLLQFLASVDVVVVVVGWPVVVEPALHTLGPVLVAIGRRILVLPQPASHRTLVRLLQAFVEGLVDTDQAPEMNVVSKLVDHDGLGAVRIPRVPHHVLLGTRADRIGPRAAQAPGPSVPEVLGLHAGVLGNVGRELVVPDHDQPRTAVDHRLPHVGTTGQHQVDQVRRLLQSKVTDIARGHDRVSTRLDVLLVERIQPQ